MLMNPTAQLTGAFRSILEHPKGDVVRLVNELLRACPEPGIRLDWHADRCRVRSLSGEWEEVVVGPIRKSVFRAMLARIAALCNEQKPDSVSAYGGQGEVAAASDSTATFKVSFANTVDDQWLSLARAEALKTGPGVDGGA